MLARSTGLGKTELTMKIASLERQGDYILMHLDVVEPVRWKVRVGVNIKDIGVILKEAVKPSILGLLLSVTKWRKNPEHPGDF